MHKRLIRTLPEASRVLALTFLTLAFWSFGPTPRVAAEGADLTTVILVRHAEKTKAKEDPTLTADGWSRAANLVHVLGKAGIDTVFSTPFRRTTGTATPIAQHLGLDPMLVEVSSDFPSRLAHRIREEHRGQTVLVVSHSNTTPAIIDALGAGPAPAIDERQYDDLFVVTLPAKGKARLLQLHYGAPTP